MLLILFIDYSSNSKKIAEDEQYIIRHYVTASLFDDISVPLKWDELNN